MEDTTYNGWTNRETWVTNLWLTNDEVLYNHVENLTVNHRGLVIELSDEIREVVEGLLPETSGLMADLISSAISHINFYELAEHYLADFNETYLNA